MHQLSNSAYTGGANPFDSRLSRPQSESAMDGIDQPAGPRPVAAGGSPGVRRSCADMILSLKLAPGTALSRLRLQAQFGVSSTPIRDALMRLEEAGLVEVFPQSGTIVSLIDVALARQAQFLRRAIEQEVVRMLAAAPDAALVDRLAAVIDEQKRPREEAGPRALQRSGSRLSQACCSMPRACPTSGCWSAIAADTSIASAACICRSATRRSRSSAIIPRS